MIVLKAYSRAYRQAARVYFTLAVLLFVSPCEARAGAIPFELQTAAGKKYSGPLAGLTKDWGVHLGGLYPVILPGHEVISLRRLNSSLPGNPLAPHIQLTNGDRIPINVKKGIQFSNSKFRVYPADSLQPEKGTTFDIPSSLVSLLWVQAPQNVSQAEPFLRQLLIQERNLDLVLLQNGDQAEGIFVDLDSTASVKLKFANKPVVVPFDRVSLIAFNDLFLLREPPKKAFAQLVLANGCRLSLAEAQFDANQQKLIGRTFFKADIQIPLTQIIGWQIFQGRAVYLSDLKPKQYEYQPFFGVTWPFLSDASVSGSGLKLAGDTFDKGLGVHCGSQLTYGLDAQYEWFETVVGLDENRGKHGAVRVNVLLDGKPQDLGWDKELRGTDKPLSLRLNVGKAKLLTLKVDVGEWGYVQGHVNWANARLIKK